MEHVERIVDRGKEGRKGGKTDNIKTFIEGGAKLVKHRVSIRVEHTIFRNCRIHRFLRSRRSQFPLSLSFSLLFSLSSPRNRALLGHHLLSPLSHSPSNPIGIYRQYHSGKTKDGYRVSTSTSFHPSIPPCSSRYTEQGEGEERWHRIVRLYTPLWGGSFFFFFGIISLKIISKMRWKKGKLPFVGIYVLFNYLNTSFLRIIWSEKCSSSVGCYRD